MEIYLLPILEKGGPIGAVVVVLVLVTGFVLRQKGWLIQSSGKVVSNSQLTELSSRVGALDTRLGAVENEIRHLPTREEMHELKRNQAVLAERLSGLEKTTTSTNHAVARIETFLLEIAKGANR